MPRLSALLLLLSLAPVWAVAGEFARAVGAAEIGAAVSHLGDGAAPGLRPNRLLHGTPALDLDFGAGSPTAPAVRREDSLGSASNALARSRLPPPAGCTPHSQRLPYDATAPPAVG
ncbi:MAG TPA: hypothetical protein VMN39_09720 [Longimicrobiaceae bacterium]|nr:hypothetical protein [Longimicrobiaceae bacterium]